MISTKKFMPQEQIHCFFYFLGGHVLDSMVKELVLQAIAKE